MKRPGSSFRGASLRAGGLWTGVLACLLGGALLGCEGLKGGTVAEAPTWKHRAGWNLELDYSKRLVARTRRTGEPYERGQPEIDVSGRRVFVGSSDNGLYALNAVNGETIWRFETLGFVQCAPLYDPTEDVLYFGSNDGALYKVRAESGKLLWRLSTNAEVARRPVLSGDMLYVANANDTVVAVEPKTGKVIWSQHRTPAMGMEVAGYSGPEVAFGKVYMGFSDGTVTAFDAVSGDERWQPVDLAGEAEQTLGEIPKYLDVDTTPIATSINAGNVVIFGSYAGGVYALEAESGVLVWSNPTVLGVSDLELWHQAAAVRNGAQLPAQRLLLVSTGTTGLWALNPETGQEVWRRDLPAGGVTHPVPYEGALLLNATQLGTYLLSPLDGSLIDGIHFTDGVSTTPAVHDRRAFVFTNGGVFYAFTINAPGEPPRGGYRWD